MTDSSVTGNFSRAEASDCAVQSSPSIGIEGVVGFSMGFGLSFKS